MRRSSSSLCSVNVAGIFAEQVLELYKSHAELLKQEFVIHVQWVGGNRGDGSSTSVVFSG